jgi:hypothetical protein
MGLYRKKKITAFRKNMLTQLLTEACSPDIYLLGYKYPDGAAGHVKVTDQNIVLDLL